MSARVLVLGLAALVAAALGLSAQIRIEPTGFCKCATDTLYEQPDPPPDVPDCVQTFGVEVWGSIDGQCRELPQCNVSPLVCTFSVVVFARSVPGGDPCEWVVEVDGTPLPTNSSGNVNTQAVTAPPCGGATVISYEADDVDLGTISLLCEECSGGLY